MKRSENEEAASQVIGTILLVAVAMTLAIGFTVYVFQSMNDQPDPAKNIAFTTEVYPGDATTNDIIALTIAGGTATDIRSLTALNVTVADRSGNILIGPTDYLQPNTGTDASRIRLGDLKVNAVAQIDAGAKSGDGKRPYTIAVTGTFSDGTQQILYTGRA